MKRYQTSLLSIVTVLVCAMAVWSFVNSRAMGAIRGQLEQSAFLAVGSVETEINRFRYLPTIAGEDARIRMLLREPRNLEHIAAANRYLATVARASGASFLYLLDAGGPTLTI